MKTDNIDEELANKLRSRDTTLRTLIGLQHYGKLWGEKVRRKGFMSRTAFRKTSAQLYEWGIVDRESTMAGNRNRVEYFIPHDDTDLKKALAVLKLRLLEHDDDGVFDDE